MWFANDLHTDKHARRAIEPDNLISHAKAWSLNELLELVLPTYNWISPFCLAVSWNISDFLHLHLDACTFCQVENSLFLTLESVHVRFSTTRFQFGCIYLISIWLQISRKHTSIMIYSFVHISIILGIWFDIKVVLKPFLHNRITDAGNLILGNHSLLV